MDRDASSTSHPYFNRNKLLVLGSDEFHRSHLEKLARDSGYGLDTTFRVADLKDKSRNPEDLKHLIGAIEEHIEGNGSTIAGAAGYWDFPVTLIQAYLCDRYHFSGAGLLSTLKCEHKYWARLEQEKVIPEFIPNFLCFDPFHDPLKKLQQLDLPYWIKPVKSCSSQLAIKIEDRSQEPEAIERIKQGIHSISAPIGFFLEKVNTPEEVPSHSGTFCIAEECLNGEQATIEGYRYQGETHTFAVVDSLSDEFGRSFNSYIYPSQLPRAIESKMHNISHKVMEQIGYDNGTFNIEFFYDKDHNKLTLLEVNPRISQSHTLPILWVDGFSNMQVSFDLAMGYEPQPAKRKGPCSHAGKFYLRHYHDAKVLKTPSQERLRQITHSAPYVKLTIPIAKGDRLSDLKEQDSYSYELGALYLSGSSRKELINSYEYIKNNLPFSLKDTA